jgi:SAM-dependent methyltransferase
MTDDHREYVEENRERWEELAAVHPDTDAYEVEAFLAGESTLDPVEPVEVGPVDGRTLLHLQCHFGLDSLSWAREGARVTGVDFAATAVEEARSLAAEAGLDDRARFVRSDVYDLPSSGELAPPGADTGEGFDVVYTSFGVLYWLPDLEAWAEAVAGRVHPGGRFYLAEHHPFTGSFDEASPPDALRVAYPYFEGRITTDDEYSYAGASDLDNTRAHGWAHSMGEVLTALAAAGLRIEFVEEYPWSTFRPFGAMEEGEDGRYYLPTEHDLPFVFTLRARRPE